MKRSFLIQIKYMYYACLYYPAPLVCNVSVGLGHGPGPQLCSLGWAQGPGPSSGPCEFFWSVNLLGYPSRGQLVPHEILTTKRMRKCQLYLPPCPGHDVECSRAPMLRLEDWKMEMEDGRLKCVVLVSSFPPPPKSLHYPHETHPGPRQPPPGFDECFTLLRIISLKLLNASHF